MLCRADPCIGIAAHRQTFLGARPSLPLDAAISPQKCANSILVGTCTRRVMGDVGGERLVSKLPRCDIDGVGERKGRVLLKRPRRDVCLSTSQRCQLHNGCDGCFSGPGPQGIKAWPLLRDKGCVAFTSPGPGGGQHARF